MIRIFCVVAALLCWCTGVGSAFAQISNPGNSGVAAGSASVLEWAAGQIAQNLGKVGCHHSPCTVLVTNFVVWDSGNVMGAIPSEAYFASRYGSLAGHQLSDLLATELSKGGGKIAVIERPRFEGFLLKERLGNRSQNEVRTAQWIAQQMQADAVITGEIAETAKNQIELKLEFLSANPKKADGVELKQKFAVDGSRFNLSIPYKPENLQLPSEATNGQVIYPASLNGVGIPSCFYMPNPRYTSEARTYKYSGTINVGAVVGTDGKIEDLWIQTGAPYGLSRSILSTLEAWECRTATKKGVPTPAEITLEISMRLY